MSMPFQFVFRLVLCQSKHSTAADTDRKELNNIIAKANNEKL